jgi:uncharacterized protein
MIATEWLWGLAGGALIGLAGSIYLLVNGRIMGASGILGGLIDGSGHATWPERLWFLGGCLTVPALIAWGTGGAQTHITGNLGVIMLAGLLVGIGTRLANGCTSGHGVCGLSRLSPRGLVATLLYLLAGAAVMAAARHLWQII